MSTSAAIRLLKSHPAGREQAWRECLQFQPQNKATVSTQNLWCRMQWQKWLWAHIECMVSFYQNPTAFWHTLLEMLFIVEKRSRVEVVQMALSRPSLTKINKPLKVTTTSRGKSWRSWLRAGRLQTAFKVRLLLHMEVPHTSLKPKSQLYSLNLLC